MSEQTVALKTAVKAKGKASPLEGLLKAGQLNSKDDKEFVKKLLEMTKKGEIELDKNGSLKLKNTQFKAEELDATALFNIKSLLSQIKLNDKLAIEKSVKELRESVAKGESKKGTEAKDLKKLLELAKEGGLDVKKVSVEKLEEGEAKKTEKTPKIADKKLVSEQKPELHKNDKTEKTEKSEKITAETPEKQTKEPLKETKKETPSLVSLLQDAKTKEATKEAVKEVATTVVSNEIRKDAAKEQKEFERHLKKDSKKEFDTKPQFPQKASDTVAAAFKGVNTEEGKVKTDTFGLADFFANKERSKDESIISKREHVGIHTLELQKHSDNELKGKMAIASEGLKNFSSDLKETIENYRPPLMKVSMELNPQNLGSVDVTLISRGSNLIVNVSSSQDTMQMFMQNIQEFRQNLMAQGFVSLQMNFNFSDQNKEQNNKNWQKEAAKKYQINSEEIGKIESLDIVIPHPKYA